VSAGKPHSFVVQIDAAAAEVGTFGCTVIVVEFALVVVVAALGEIPALEFQNTLLKNFHYHLFPTLVEGVPKT
jgi:hypothetical protein